MNKYFLNIKVDREERPDIDYIFQSSFQLSLTVLVRYRTRVGI